MPVVGANAVTCFVEVADDGASRADDSDCADGAIGAEGDEDVRLPVCTEGIEGRKDPVAVATSSASTSHGADCSRPESGAFRGIVELDSPL